MAYAIQIEAWSIHDHAGWCDLEQPSLRSIFTCPFWLTLNSMMRIIGVKNETVLSKSRVMQYKESEITFTMEHEPIWFSFSRLMHGFSLLSSWVRVNSLISHVGLMFDLNQSPWHVQFMCLCALGNLWWQFNYITRRQMLDLNQLPRYRSIHILVHLMLFFFNVCAIHINT